MSNHSSNSHQSIQPLASSQSPENQAQSSRQSTADSTTTSASPSITASSWLDLSSMENPTAPSQHHHLHPNSETITPDPPNETESDLDLRSATILSSQMRNRMEFARMMKERLAAKEVPGVKVLCLDGGGIRGLVEIEMLRLLSQEIYSDSTGAQFINQFDLICGTSAGGILSLALTQGFELSTCKQIFFDLGSKIFKKRIDGGYLNYMWNGNFYSTSLLENLFEDYLGTNPISQSIKRPVFVVSTDATYKEWGTVLFRSYEHECSYKDDADSSQQPKNPKKHQHIHEDREDHATSFATHELPVSLCARVTSAAPTYFKAVNIEDRVFVDGGCTANNPSELAVFEAKKLWPNRNIDLVLSLGTGKPTESMGSQNVIPLLNEMIDICSSSESSHKHVKNWLKISMPHTAYFRFSPNNGEGSIRLDESNRTILDQMLVSTQEYMQRKNDAIQELKEVMLCCKSAPPPYKSDTSDVLIDDFELL